MPKVRRSRLNQLPDPATAEQEARQRGIEIIEDVGPTPVNPLQPVLGQVGLAQEVGKTPLGQAFMGNLVKTASDTAFGIGGAALLSPIPGGVALGSMGGQALSDYVFGTPPKEMALNTAIAGGIPGGLEAGTRIASIIPRIAPRTITNTIKAAVRTPLGFGGFRLSRPGVGIREAAEANLGSRLGDFAAAEQSASTASPIAQQQIATKSSILARYQGIAQLNPQMFKQMALNIITKGKPMFTQEVKNAQKVFDKLAGDVDALAQARGGYLELDDVETLLDQLRQSAGEFNEPGRNLIDTGYRELQHTVDDMIRGEVKDPQLRALYDEVSADMKIRLDARDALRQKLGKAYKLGGQTRFANEEAIVRAVDNPTSEGRMVDEILQAIDESYGTKWYQEAKRLKAMRQWTPDDRRAVSGVLGALRAFLSPAARLAAKFGAPLTGLSPQLIPAGRGLATQYLGEVEKEPLEPPR